MRFEILGAISGIEVIARGKGVHHRRLLNKRYGGGNWRKLKGFATIRYADGTTCEAELHWYEAHGVGRRDVKVKRILRLL